MEIYNKKNKCSETDILYLKLNENGNRAYSYKNIWKEWNIEDADMSNVKTRIFPITK